MIQQQHIPIIKPINRGAAPKPTKDRRIFETMDTSGIPYVVIVALMTTRMPELDHSKRDYFLIVRKVDEPEPGWFKRLGFRQASHKPRSLQERSLTPREIVAFREIIAHRFQKTFHSQDGRVYELIDNPFKKQSKQ